MVEQRLMLIFVFALVAIATGARADEPYDPNGSAPEATASGSICGLVQTNSTDPDWILMASDRILRANVCVASGPCCPTGWFDRINNPCYTQNSFWKLAPGAAAGSAFPMAGLGQGTFDGLYIKPGVPYQIFSGSDTSTPVGPSSIGPLFASNSHWSGNPCAQFEPGTLLVETLDTHSIAIGPDAACPSSGGPSPFAAPQADDRTFVVNEGPGLDTGCTYRSGGPLIFNIEVTRYVGPTLADGTLRDAGVLVQAGVLAPYATLVMPAYDVDFAGAIPGTAPERDRVSFNGTVMNALFPINSAFLQGDNNIWRVNSFQIPIAKVKFPAARGLAGAPPTPALNEVRIDLDIANVAQAWCTALDWAALSIKATSPVILIHGNGSAGAFFQRQGFTAGLDAARLLWDNSINFVPAANTIIVNGDKLKDEIPGLVASFGVDSVHLVCHSKGGLDAREYLAIHQPGFDDQFKVLSYTSLSTPHNGSVLADLVVERWKGAAATATSKVYVGFPDLTEWIVESRRAIAGYDDLQTTASADFNAANLALLPSDVIYNTVAADLDQNGNGRVDTIPPEWQELALEDPVLNNPPGPYSGETVLNVAYQILRGTATISVTSTANFLGWTTVTTTANPTPGPPVGNDVLVTIPSAQGVGTFASRVSNSTTLTGANGRNHASVANAGVASTVSGWIISVERAEGDLR